VIVVRTAFIAPQGISNRPGEQFVIDLIWLCVTPEDRVEHVRVLAVPRGFHIVWFMLGRSEKAARAIALSIGRRVAAATPILREWDIS
jgi:hypothetical protein